MSTTDDVAPAVPGPLNVAEMLEYKRLTALLDDNYDRRQRLTLMKAGLAKDTARLAAIEARQAELIAGGCAISHLRRHLHGRYKWPNIYRGQLSAPVPLVERFTVRTTRLSTVGSADRVRLEVFRCLAAGQCAESPLLTVMDPGYVAPSDVPTLLDLLKRNLPGS